MDNGKKSEAGNGIAIEPLVEAGKACQPEADIVEDHGSLVLYVDLPGVAPGQAKVEVDENNVLSIRAGNGFAEPKGDLMRQFRVGDYYRAFQLGRIYDREAIHAELVDGTLVLTIPKKAEAKPKVIEIKA
jgi:HSP20 family protein